MPTEYNKAKATILYENLDNNLTHEEWIKMLIKVVGFLLARYIDGK